VQGLSRQFSLPVPDFSVTPPKIKLGNSRFVGPDDDLVELYDWLKSSDRDSQMGTLSENNPRSLILTSGYHDLSSGLLLDTDDVHIYHFGPAEACVVDYTGVSIGLTNDNHSYTVKQTADRITLQGFTIHNTTNTPRVSAFVLEPANALWPLFTYNEKSYYKFMNFRKANISTSTRRFPVFHQSDEHGKWLHCVADGMAWRVADGVDFNPTMWDCMCEGDYGFGGDNNGNPSGTGTIGGKFYKCVGQKYSFGGCSSYGMAITSSAEFWFCESGERSFGLSMNVAGTFYYCIGGRSCFGGYPYSFNESYTPNFSGEAYYCKAGANSFGSGVRGTGTEPKFSGVLFGCVIEGDSSYGESFQCEGGRIENCRIVMAATNQHALILTDGNTKVYNSTLISTGTGNSIYAASAQNVVATHCRMNADKHANVTNLIGGGALADGYCVMDSDVG